MVRHYGGRTYQALKTIPMRNQGCNGDCGLSRKDARDQARQEARSIRKGGRCCRVIPNADGFGIWVEES